MIHPLLISRLIFLNEVNKMDLSNETIKELFYKQIKDLTLNRKTQSFDYQFSGKLLEV